MSPSDVRNPSIRNFVLMQICLMDLALKPDQAGTGINQYPLD